MDIASRSETRAPMSFTGASTCFNAEDLLGSIVEENEEPPVSGMLLSDAASCRMQAKAAKARTRRITLVASDPREFSAERPAAWRALSEFERAAFLDGPSTPLRGT